MDSTLKINGFSLTGEYYFAELDAGGGNDVDATGWYAQSGYMIGDNFEIAGRVGQFDCDQGGCGSDFDDLFEYGAAVNYYWWQHHMKAQLSYTLLDFDGLNGEGDSDASQVILQLSSWF